MRVIVMGVSALMAATLAPIARAPAQQSDQQRLCAPSRTLTRR
jgi:hypothetical protein